MNAPTDGYGTLESYRKWVILKWKNGRGKVRTQWAGRHSLSFTMLGDRVQWFRAEAEMQRWQEHREQKIAELLRVNRSFQKMQQTWTTLAFTNSLTGHQAYARQKAAMYCKRAEQAQTLITAAGYRELLYENASIVRRIQLDRDQEAKIVAEALVSRNWNTLFVGQVWKMNLVETDGNAISVIQVKWSRGQVIFEFKHCRIPWGGLWCSWILVYRATVGITSHACTISILPVHPPWIISTRMSIIDTASVTF